MTTQLDLAKVDPRRLQAVLDKASARRDAYEAAIRAVELMLGMASDELGFDTDGEMLDFAADALIAHAQAVLDGEGQDEEGDGDGEDEDGEEE